MSRPFINAHPGLDLLETFRPDIIASLTMNWWNDDLCEPADHYLAVAKAPSLTKEALSVGLLQGELKPLKGGLSGTLELTAEGRYLVRRMRLNLSKSQTPKE